MYNRILVPTDGSAGIGRVIDHAAQLAQKHDAELHFLYVVNTASFANLPMETSWESVTSMLRDEGETALADAKSRVGEQAAKTVIVDGSPSREIVEYAVRERCDLIVMGTNGRGGLNRLLLGSIAERVVRNSKIPVLTVRISEAEPTAEPVDEPVEESVEELQPVTADPAVSEALE